MVIMALCLTFILLSQLHRWSPEEACKMLASVRPHVLIRSAQLEVLQEYYKQVCASESS